MAGGVVAPAPTQQASSHVSRRPIPPGLVPVAVLLAAAVGLVSLLPSVAQAVWEVPHLLLLGLVISYGVFAQRNNADADGGNASKEERSLAWNARYQYHPDGSLVVVADHAAAASDDDEEEDGGQHGARERPFSLPVRRLKSAAAVQESEPGGDAAVFGEEETDSCASSSGFWAAGARAVPSPPSVLDADLSLLSPCSQPQSSSRPFSVHSGNKSSHGFNATSPSTMSRVPHAQPWSDDDGEGTDWGEEDAEGSDEMTTVSSERSVRGDFAAAACGYGHSEGDTSVDEELLALAAKAELDGEEEVDRKADEFIAKFREQIRLQRH